MVKDDVCGGSMGGLTGKGRATNSGGKGRSGDNASHGRGGNMGGMTNGPDYRSASFESTGRKAAGDYDGDDD